MFISLITGICGQDGSYLCELLLEKKYKVYGIIRRSSSLNTSRIEHLLHNKNLNLVYGDMTDAISISNIIKQIKHENPDLQRLEIYNLAAQSHVLVSFKVPLYTGEVDALGVLKLLECIKNSDYSDKIKLYQASTSEMFGKVQEIPQTETTPFYPRSPYGCAKLYAHWITINYREAYNLYACSGILYNHESPRRAHNFVTRKITIGLNKILKDRKNTLYMGNLNSLRDWSHAKDCVFAMWLMLQQDKPDDYIICSNTMHSVREFIEKSFSLKNISIKWKGIGINEEGYDEKTGETLIKIDEKYFRPTEVDLLLGNPNKAITKLGWKQTISFDTLVEEMVNNDCI